MIEIKEEAARPELTEELIALSRLWEAENSCRGYRENGEDDIEGRRVFTAREDGRLVGYLFGAAERAKERSSVMDAGARYFELEELYVVPELRSRGIGRGLFSCAEKALRGDAERILLSTATKDWRRILHFYIEELGMDFWSARLFKEITG